MTERTLVCLGGGTEAVPIIRRVKKLGYRAIVVDGNPQAPGFAFADVPVVASCYHADEIKPQLHGLIAIGRGGFDGVLCCAIDAPTVAAEVARAFGLPGLSVEAARLSSDKELQIRALSQAGIPVPEYVADGVHLMSYGPCVVKPVDSRGARGVVRLMPGESWVKPSNGQKMIIEKWLPGPQLSTESIVQDGEVLFTAVALRNYDRLEEFAPHVIEDGCDAPYGDAALLDECNQVIRASCRALGWYPSGGGTVKGDLVIHDGQVKVIELAARLSGGFLSSHTIPLAYGVDMLKYAIQLALGDAPAPWPPAYDIPRFVSQRYVFPDKQDIDKTVASVPDLSAIPGFATWNIKPGQTALPVDSHPRRWGQVTVSAVTPEQAREEAARLVVRMKEGVTLE